MIIISESLLFLLRFGSFQCYIFFQMAHTNTALEIAIYHHESRHICKLVLEHKNVEISFPNATEHYNIIKMGFHNKFGIKGVIGDCTHVAIIGPGINALCYYYYLY
ncbi:uncharacterized protein LOC120781196 [Bactrocera tryoni]|uniref:uncharacterized protein LOC120781196 n=1 Tax=Bactrocera tryoni TaxID=59916 RepID=UPI001A9799C9|nr:uncharacterized protein LOC120781196 [Bactrocera tryoni]